MTLPVSIVADDIGHIAAHVALHDRYNQAVDVTAFGAVGDGATDDTDAFADAVTAAAGGTLFLPGGGTFLIDPGLTFADDTAIVGWGATVKRRANGAAALLTVGARCAVYGLRLDGNMTALGSSTGAERGLVCGAQPTLVSVRSFDHYGHGIRVNGTSTDPGGSLLGCHSYSNGQTPGASGTADGIYLQNCFHVALVACRAYDNARTGLTATTATPAATESVGVRLVACRSYGNGYNDANLEFVSEAAVTDLHADGVVTFANSPRCKFTNVHASKLSGDTADRPVVLGAYLTGLTESLYLTGASPVVFDVVCDPAGTPTGNLFVVQPSDDSAHITSARLVHCNNGFLFDIGTGFNANQLHIENSTNVRYKWNHAGGQGSSGERNVEFVNGFVRLLGAAAPTVDDWQRGDRVINRTPASPGTSEWVCVTAGTPGTWAAVAIP